MSDLGQALVSLQSADASSGPIDEGHMAFEATFFDKDDRAVTLSLKNFAPEGWFARSSHNRRWARVPPRWAEDIVELGEKLK